MEKNTYDDLASLFLLDVFHGQIANPYSTTQSSNPESDRTPNGNFVRTPASSGSSKDHIDLNTDSPFLYQSQSQANFANFLNNNNFITSKPVLSTGDTNGSSHINSHTYELKKEPELGYSGHYGSFVPIEATYVSHHHHNHVMQSQSYPVNIKQDPAYFTGTNGNLENEGLSYHDLEFPNNLNSPSYPVLPGANILGPNKLFSPMAQDQASADAKNKRKRSNRRAQATPRRDLIIDYSKEKLIRLLDFKSRNLNNDCALFDKDGNKISIEFKGFLNGRFLTNDLDNGNYIHTIMREKNNNFEKAGSSESDSKEPESKKKALQADPKVITCYRRNFIQVAVNFKLLGFKDHNPDEPKILKLQTNEYGYNITRVVKWFKIEISANSSISKHQPVPIDILTDKEKERPTPGGTNDNIIPNSITTNEQIVTLNKSTVIDDEIDNYYTVKKIRFKSATPNNGNFTFQHYYQLKVKLSAVVADLYYDDYIDEDFNIDSTDNSRNEVSLFELESEPIIVRGRNPSFYSDRKDHLVRGRLPKSKTSYKESLKVATEEEVDFKEVDAEEAALSEAKKEPNDDNDDDDDADTNHESEDESDSKGKDTPTIPSLKYDSKPVPPVINANSSPVNLEKILQGKTDDKEGSKYKYFPISNVYYLPPINVVYFPHAVHQKSKVAARANSPAVEDVPKRKRSYFSSLQQIS